MLHVACSLISIMKLLPSWSQFFVQPSGLGGKPQIFWIMWSTLLSLVVSTNVVPVLHKAKALAKLLTDSQAATFSPRLTHNYFLMDVQNLFWAP
jgi:hypothetical protein